MGVVSKDLRYRILACIDEGEDVDFVALRYEVGRRSAIPLY